MQAYAPFDVCLSELVEDLEGSAIIQHLGRTAGRDERCVDLFHLRSRSAMKCNCRWGGHTSPIWRITALADSRRGSSEGCDFCMPYSSSYTLISSHVLISTHDSPVATAPSADRCWRMTETLVSVRQAVQHRQKNATLDAKTLTTPGISSCAVSSSSIGTHSSVFGSLPMILMCVWVDFCTTRMREKTTLATRPVWTPISID